jgi:hypothetical protein
MAIYEDDGATTINQRGHSEGFSEDKACLSPSKRLLATAQKGSSTHRNRSLGYHLPIGLPLTFTINLTSNEAFDSSPKLKSSQALECG